MDYKYKNGKNLNPHSPIPFVEVDNKKDVEHKKKILRFLLISAFFKNEKKIQPNFILVHVLK